MSCLAVLHLIGSGINQKILVQICILPINNPCDVVILITTLACVQASPEVVIYHCLYKYVCINPIKEDLINTCMIVSQVAIDTSLCQAVLILASLS